MNSNKFKSLAVVGLILSAFTAQAQGLMAGAQVGLDSSSFIPLYNSEREQAGRVSLATMGYTPYVPSPLLMSVRPLYNPIWSYNQWATSPEQTRTSLNNNTQTGKTQEEMGVSCGESLPEGVLESAGKELDWGKCFDGRLSYTRDSKPDSELLTKDLEICNCLRSSKLDAVQIVMKNGAQAKIKKEILQGELQNVLNGVALQSYSMFNDSALTTGYAQNLFDTKKDKDAPVFEADMRLLRDEGPFDPKVCLTPREFLLFQQMPNSKFVKEAFQKPYNPIDWDYKKLQSTYREYMQNPSVDKINTVNIEEVKEKLLFLNRNPLVKYALGSNDFALAEKRKQIFTSVAAMSANPGCNHPLSPCYREYQKTISKIFADTKVRDAIREETSVDYKSRAERAEAKLTGNVSEKFSQRSIVQEFVHNYKLDNPDNCESGTVKDAKCLVVYSGYCKTLDKYEPQIKGLPPQNQIGKVPDDLDELLDLDVNPNLDTNKEYRRMNDELCNAQNVQIGVFNWGKATFGQFLQSYCKDKKDSHCPADGKVANYEDLMALRRAYWREYKPTGKNVTNTAVTAGAALGGSLHEERNAISSRSTLENLSEFLSDGEGLSQMPADQVRSLAAATSSSDSENNTVTDNFQKAASKFSANMSALSGMGAQSLFEKPEDKPGFMVGFGQALANGIGARSQTVAPSYDDMPMDFSNSMITPTTTAKAVSETTQKVEQMSDGQRQDMLADWQKEYSDWKKDKGGDLSPADVAKDNAMKQEIATLRALLAQQQELSTQQFKMLNEAIAAKSKPETVVAGSQSDSQSKKPSQFASAGRFPASVADEDSDASRTTASVKEQPKFNTAGANGGGTSSTVSSRKTVNVDSSRDSVAREEAKLVNMRRSDDGSITIESSGSSTAGGNVTPAISVPVSDEQYRMLQSDSNGQILGQLEKSIPKDQIAKLESKGEIILLVRNGSNPPFEVKVAKVDNRLVYSRTDKNGNKQDAVVRRTYTIKALENQLRTSR